MKTTLAFVGGVVIVLFALGFVGIGHFQLQYTDYKIECKKVLP